MIMKFLPCFCRHFQTCIFLNTKLYIYIRNYCARVIKVNQLLADRILKRIFNGLLSEIVDSHSVFLVHKEHPVYFGSCFILFFVLLFCNFMVRNYMFLTEILQRIMTPELPPFRPTVSELIENAEELRDIMKKCWLEHPDARPTFHELCKGIDSLIRANGL